MERLRIELPAVDGFTTHLDVRIGDVNYGRHLGNDALLGLLHEARLRFLAHHGFSETDAGGVGLIMTEAQISYLAQARHGDRLCIVIHPVAPGRAGFALVYGVRHATGGQEIARARTGLAFYDYERARLARMPEAFRAAVFPNLGSQAV